MIDFHCHLDLFAQPASVAEKIQAGNFGALSVTTTPAAWRGTEQLAEGNSKIRTALGLHPQLAQERRGEIELFRALLPETAFVGEVGLDGSPELKSTWDDQVAVFDGVLGHCASEGGRLLSIHSRRAVGPTLAALERSPGAGRPILHWFSGSFRELEKAIEFGCWFSIGPGMLSSARGRALALAMPRARLLLETDGPFVLDGGLPAVPWKLDRVVQRLSQLFQESDSAIAALIESNESAVLAGFAR
ncbi:MAG: TatD family hydrolase [Actinomycetales bacterium]|nr:TatD family hydrolase [Actinomycetales bacterium]